jgi:hypothetical protein
MAGVMPSTVELMILGRNSSNSIISSAGKFVPIIGGDVDLTATLSHADTVSIDSVYVRCVVANGTSVDFTIRISQPQLTQTAYKMPFIAPEGSTIADTSVVSCAGTTTHGTRWPMDAKVLVALGSGGAFTVCSLDKMGAGSAELPAGAQINVNILSAYNTTQFLRAEKQSSNNTYIATGYDGVTSVLAGVNIISARYEIHARYVQTNPANPLQWRVGYRRYNAGMAAIDEAIVWGSWGAYEGSMNPLDYLRAFYTNTTPIWKIATMTWNSGNLTDAYLNQEVLNAI